MDFDKLTYPETITIDGIAYKGKRNMSKGQVLIPYTDAPNVGIGDVIAQKTDKKDIHLKVTDASFIEGGSLGVGTDHPHMLTLKVANTTAQPPVSKKQPSTINVGSVSGEQTQVYPKETSDQDHKYGGLCETCCQERGRGNKIDYKTPCAKQPC